MVVDWLRRILVAEAPPPDVVAFNVGLIETENGYAAYLIGSKSFDPGDDDWACSEDFSPTERYCEIGAGRSDETWEAVRDRVAEEVRKFLSTPEAQNSFLGRAKAVTVGFDDGDLLRIA